MAGASARPFPAPSCSRAFILNVPTRQGSAARSWGWAMRIATSPSTQARRENNRRRTSNCQWLQTDRTNNNEDELLVAALLRRLSTQQPHFEVCQCLLAGEWLFPPPEAFADDFHRCHHRLIQARIIGNVATPPFALTVHRIAHPSQIKDDFSNFIRRSAGNTLN